MLLFSSDVQQYMICKSGCAHECATMHHTHTHARTHARTHTDTLVLVLVLVLSQPELAAGNKTPLAMKTPASPVAWPLRCSRGTHVWACKTHEMREVGHGLE